MAAELIFASEAERDIDAAYAWYEAQSVGLGEDFSVGLRNTRRSSKVSEHVNSARPTAPHSRIFRLPVDPARWAG